MYCVPHVINTVIKLGYEMHIFFTPEQLNYILYLIYCEYLQQTGASLFYAGFETSATGPSLPYVRLIQKRRGNKPLETYLNDNEKEIKTIPAQTNPKLILACKAILGKYGLATVDDLRVITTQAGTAWHKAKTKNRAYLSDNDISIEK